MSKKIFAFYILGFLLGISGANPAQADIFTVSTVDQLLAAVQAAQAGDVIELTDGVYQLNTGNGIVIQDKTDLTIRSQSGNRDAVIIQGEGINDTSTSFIFKLYRSTYFTLQDLTMKDVYWHHIQINEGSSYFTLRNLVMLDAGEAPVKVTSPGGNGPFSDHGLIEGCWLGFSNYGARNVVEGIDIIASVGTVVRNCEFYRIRMKRGPQNVGWGVFAKGNAQDTVIENNYFEDTDIPISFGNGGCPADFARYGDITYQHRGGIIRNNVVNRTKDVAVYLNYAQNFKVYNNTLWSTFEAGESSIDVRFNSNGQIFNNICSQGYRLREEAAADVASNIWNADPALFIDQAGGDFHLVSSAAEAIDQGLDTSLDVPYDMDGQVRPNGLVDIGADEYVCSDRDGDGYYDTCGTYLDCNDQDAYINPGAAEVCDGVDNNCDSNIDEGCSSSCTDSDGDGYYAEGGECGPQDCNDANSQVNPGISESGRKCKDDLDNDCDDLIDGNDPDCKRGKGGSGGKTQKRN